VSAALDRLLPGPDLIADHRMVEQKARTRPAADVQQPREDGSRGSWTTAGSKPRFPELEMVLIYLRLIGRMDAPHLMLRDVSWAK
jgi:hypothetical protein